MSGCGGTGPSTRATVVRGTDTSPDRIRELVLSLLTSGGPIFITGASFEQYAAVLEVAPAAAYDEVSRLIAVNPSTPEVAGTSHRSVAVVAAGTSDVSVAEEAAVAVSTLGYPPVRIYDVGVAGIHRLLAYREDIERATCIIVVAGMEGALPSVIAGLTQRPVVAVPTSTGYGASFEGIAALLAMIEASTAGIAVVAIDDGVGAALVAHRILQSSAEYERSKPPPKKSTRP